MYKRTFRDLCLLFKVSEQIVTLVPNHSMYELNGSYKNVIEKIQSITNYQFFTKTIKTEIQLVSLNEIVWTDHPSYQQYWNLMSGTFQPKNFVGKRDPGEAGTLSGWAPLADTKVQYILLVKHPDQNKYSISGDGNNRVMKSLSTPGSLSKIWAMVETKDWNEVAKHIEKFLNEIKPYSVHINISQKITIGIMLYEKSRMFYINNISKEEISNISKIYDFYRLESLISSWEYINLKSKFYVRWELFKIYINNPS